MEGIECCRGVTAEEVVQFDLSEGKQCVHMTGQFAGLVAPSYPSVAQLGVHSRGKIQRQCRSNGFGQTSSKPALTQPTPPAPAVCLQP